MLRNGSGMERNYIRSQETGVRSQSTEYRRLRVGKGTLGNGIAPAPVPR